MAIEQAGKQFTADELQETAGSLASHLRDFLQQGDNLRIQLETWPDADLVALGLAQDEINAIKGFYIGDLPAIQTEFAASTWVKQLIGMGV